MTSRLDIRNRGEHALVQTKEQVRDLGASHTGLTQDLHEAEVGQIANEGAAGVAEGQTIAPEEPLEPHDRYTHHGEPYQGKGRLATGKTAVEKTHARDHEQDQGRGGEDPCEVARLFDEKLVRFNTQEVASEKGWRAGIATY